MAEIPPDEYAPADEFCYPGAFDEVWSAYPARTGGNPKRPAFKQWRARIRSGIPAGVLLSSVQQYKIFVERSGKLGTEFVMMAQTFFGPNERWKDFLPKPEPEKKPIAPVVKEQEERIDARPFLRELIEKLAKGVRNVR